MKYVQTVLGRMAPEDMGFTLAHEHIFFDLSFYLPENANKTKICPEILGDLKYHLWEYEDNMSMQDMDVAVQELKWYKEAGGGTICDNSCHGLHADPKRIQEASRRSGVPVILGTGAYFQPLIPEKMQKMDEDELADLFVKELDEGIEGTDVKCGFIGEIGVRVDDLPHAEKFLTAAARAQKRTGAAITIHQPGEEHKADFIFDVLTRNGADLRRVVMCHCCPYLPDYDYLERMAKAGAILSFDFFGLEAVLWDSFFLPTDKDRILGIQELLRRGLGDQIVVSHDTAYKSMERTYGGMGYVHLPKHMMPVMRAMGIAEADLHKITVTNPAGIFVREE